MRRVLFLILAVLPLGVACASEKPAPKVDHAEACRFFQHEKELAATYLKDPALAEQGRTLERQADAGLESCH